MIVLCMVRPELAAKVARALPDLDVVAVRADGELPAGVAGEVLLSLPWNTPNLRPLLASGVRWVHLLGTGVDAFPLELLGDRLLTCSRGGSAVPIAEWVLAVMLAFEKRLPDSWIHDVPPGRIPTKPLGTLNGRTLGLVGLGGIGTAVAVRALPFGMRVVAHRRSGAPSPVAGVEIAASLLEVVRAADHLVLAVPATPATRHLLSAEIFAAVKPGVHLVNVARGSLVDNDALRAALDGGGVAMASLDAVEPEPLPAGHWMYSHPRVRLSPHVSWSAPEAADRLLEMFIDNLRRYRAGEPLTCVVDVAAGY
jgi:phosphoglycerate dehydrogenase-like enzyme